MTTDPGAHRSAITISSFWKMLSTRDPSRHASMSPTFLAAVLTLTTGCSLGHRSPSEPTRPNIILILVDTLRADRLGSYGYEERTSSHIDTFANGASLFENAISQAPHTIPSVLQIMTSKYRQGRRIEESGATLAELLRQQAYETVAIVDNPHFEHESEAHGLMRGFDHFFRNGPLDRENVEQQHWKSKTPGDAIAAQARRWLKGRNTDSPFFLWLHFFDPHDPYMPPFADDMEQLAWTSDSEFTGDIRSTFLFRATRQGHPDDFSEIDRQHISRLYDAEIRYLDLVLGELFHFLKEIGLYDDALIVLSADHGESLGEHGGWFHGRSLYEPEIHIPLIVKYPRQDEGVRIIEPAQAIDIMPTILDVAGIEEGDWDGVTLREARERPALAFWRDWVVVRGSEWKLLSRDGELALFDLNTDPGETTNVASRNPEVVARLLEELRRRLEEIGESPTDLEAVSSDVVEQMQALGYLN